MGATKMAIDAGFCHIDTAHAYQVDTAHAYQDVGQVTQSKIGDRTVKSEDIFLTSKAMCL
jgi:diketogulonate reductase-like aldo/keto reductase